jgi:endonuclease YncB( thermonuclease family)
MHTRMSRAVAVVALLFLAVATGKSNGPLFDPAHPPRAGDEGVFYGPLVRVKDGDSLIAKVQGVAMDFRLADVDAPELDQPYSRQAQRELASLAKGQQLVLLPIDTDRYGRTIAHVWNGDTYLNEEMVKRGAVWFYPEFARGAAFYDVEQEARNAKRGLWALPLKDRVEPWVWRKRKRERN